MIPYEEPDYNKKAFNCPYCNAEQEINHDDGYGFMEDEKYQQECGECEKIFTYTTSIVYYYESKKADCLNGTKHDFNPTHTYPKEYTRMRCSMCDEERKPTKEELKEILKEEPTKHK